jgi:imidazole glycerol-phosphate synthase subunit HisH
MARIAVIDYDMGNLHSVCKALELVGGEPFITHDARAIKQAEGILLPGVGSFDPAMQNLRSRQLEDPIRAAIASGRPFLGICLGLQILFDGSDEGIEPGLGIVPGRVKRFQSEPNLTIPHMGWNQLNMTQADCPVWQGLGETPWMYFVHSFYVEPIDPTVSSATTTHGHQTVTAAIARDNLWAAQFHPEKSSTAGLKLLSNFVVQVQQSVQQSSLAPL